MYIFVKNKTVKREVVYDKWLPYEDYEKLECDIKLKDRTVVNHCWANAGKFTPLCSDHIDPIPEEQVAEIRYTKYYVKDKCKGNCNSFSKKQAIEYMRQGKRVTHQYFSDHEWITMQGNHIVCEDGCRTHQEGFWKYREGESFEKEWRLHETQPEPTDEIVGNLGGYDVRLMNNNSISKGEENRFLVKSNKHYPKDPIDDWAGSPKTLPKVRDAKRIYNNDPCICGSGLKYKRCCKHKYH